MISFDIVKQSNGKIVQQERVEKVQDDIQILSDEMDDKFDVDTIALETFTIKLRRTDIEVDEIAIVWEAP